MRKSSAMLLAALALCAAQAFASNTHTVTFRRMNGTVLQKVEVEHGANATSLVPAGPDESANDLSFSRWDFVDKLACVTNDVTCWALYEATAAKSPSTSIQSKPVVDRGLPYSLDEYFQMYDNLAWSDEFSGTSLDTGRKYSYWGQTYYQGGTWRYYHVNNNELQQYTDGENVTLSDGTLKIIARRETKGDYKFTSASIKTDGCVQVKYGRCEIRAKLPKQQGTFPAFWMIRDEKSGGFYSELDIFEQINGYDWIGGCFHRDVRNSTSEPHMTDSNSGVACTEDGTSWGDEFHRIGAIFNEHEIIWYVDDHIFKRMDVRSRDRYSVYHSNSWYILLNLAIGGWAGEKFPDGNDDPRIANFLSDVFEIDYCRIFTNTTVDNTVQREAEPAGAKLSAPVKATVWRGWQMNWARPGSNYYMNHLVSSEAIHIHTALSEYFARDKPDVVTFMTKPTEHTGEYDKIMSYDIPGISTLSLSPDQGVNYEEGYSGITPREMLLSCVMFNKERFSTARSAISSLPISNDADFTNCCAVVAELVENDTGAKVKVVGVNVVRTNGVDNASGVVGQGFSTLMSKLNAMKDEKVILFLQGEGWNNWNYIDKRVNSELKPSFSKIGQCTSAWPAYQSAWVTANYSASAENPAPLSVPKSNGQPSGVYTNQAYCATVQFEAPEPEPAIEYGQLDMSGFAKKMTVTFSGAQSGTTLTNFPVLVKLSTAIDGFSYADFARQNGGDLRFADAGGNLIPHEIDTWNENGVSAVWVKVPQLAKDTAITAHYGYTGSGDPVDVDPKDVWDSNYVGVWHLGESALPMAESTGVSTPFASKTGTASYGAAGAVGGSVDFTAAKGTESFLTAADDDDLDGFNDFTVEMWTCQDSFYNANEAYAGTLVKRNARADNESWFTYQDKATLKPGLAYGNDSAASDRTLALANSLPATGAWTHQAFVRTVGTSKVVAFMDGAENGTTVKSSGSVFAGAAPLMLGGGGGQKSFPGKIDEVRISKVARSAAWIKATHDTVMQADFATYSVRGASASGYAAWIAGKGITGANAAAEKVTNGIANGVRYAFDIDPATSEIGTPIIQVVRDAAGNPSVQSRDLATGRDDVTFGILATPDLTDWSNATLVPMTKFATDGLWKPAASGSAGYVFPSQMFFKYKIDIQQ